MLAGEPKQIDLADYIVEVRDIVHRAGQSRSGQERLKTIHKGLVRLNSEHRKKMSVVVAHFPVAGERGDSLLLCRSAEEIDGMGGVKASSTFPLRHERLKPEEREWSKVVVSGIPLCNSEQKGSRFTLTDGPIPLYIHLVGERVELHRATE